jgi:RES domain-containing protein
MQCCAGCFREHANPLAALIRETPIVANCEVCERSWAEVWDAQDLLDPFSTLVSHYEVSDDPNAVGLAESIQRDWRVFSDEAEPKITVFLAAVFSGQATSVPLDAPVRLRRDEEPGEHLDAWDRFAQDLMYGNRFFPEAMKNLKNFEHVVSSRAVRFEPGVEFFRARVCDTADGIPGDRMSMPPPAKATAGRANPAGIPHLYLARELETCIRECRAVQHNFVSVARFRTTDPLLLLDLNGFRPVDPFVLESAAAKRLDAARTIERLGRELQRPVRPTDNEVEYVPTQYLSGLVRKLELAGILYSSSLHPGGTNAVLFDGSKVELLEEPQTFEITSMTLVTKPATWSPTG